MTASKAPPAPPAITSRRPIRSDHDEAGKAASAAASEPTVPTIPIRASSNPMAARYRLKSIQKRLVAAPPTSVTSRNRRASGSNPR